MNQLTRKDPIGLSYNKEKNWFEDEDGYAIFDIFQIITPNQLLVFKHLKEYMTVIGPRGDLVELFYPEDDYDEKWPKNTE